MALWKYLCPLNGLPDPKGSLSSRIPSAVIAEANRLVNETRKEETEIKKRGSHKKYFSSVWLQIAEYACHHGVALAPRVFSHKLQHNVSESTVCSIRDVYRQELRKKRRCEDDEDEMSVLPSSSHCRVNSATPLQKQSRMVNHVTLFWQMSYYCPVVAA